MTRTPTHTLPLVFFDRNAKAAKRSPINVSGAFHRSSTLICLPGADFMIAKPREIDGKLVFANQFEEENWDKWKDNQPELAALARRNVEGFVDAIRPYTNVIETHQRPGCPDDIFTADASISFLLPDRHIGLLSNFTNPNRVSEPFKRAEKLRELYPKKEIIQNLLNIEGCGDNVYDPFRHLIWSGYSTEEGNAQHGRSNRLAHAFLQEMTGIEVVSLQTSYPFYHNDTLIGPLSRGHMLAYMDGMSEETKHVFMYHAFERFDLDPEEYLIKLSEEDAYRLAANVRCYGDAIIMPETSKELREEIESKGYKNVTQVNMDGTIALGGGPHCCSNVVDERILLLNH